MLFSDKGMSFLFCVISQLLINAYLRIFKFPDLIPLEEFDWSNLTPSLHGEDKRLFLEFAKKVLQWDLEHRATAEELYRGSWLSL